MSPIAFLMIHAAGSVHDAEGGRSLGSFRVVCGAPDSLSLGLNIGKVEIHLSDVETLLVSGKRAALGIPRLNMHELYGRCRLDFVGSSAIQITRTEGA